MGKRPDTYSVLAQEAPFHDGESLMPQQATSIDDVIRRLTEIVEESATRPSRLGYFAALYRKVTITVKQHIDAGDYFEDNARMERLDVLFANRFLQAYDQLQAGTPTRCWGLAFQVTHQWWPIALQHQLLGINAHINLDLGIAAAQTVGTGNLASLHGDFNRINDLLAGLVGDVKEELASRSSCTRARARRSWRASGRPCGG